MTIILNPKLPPEGPTLKLPVSDPPCLVISTDWELIARSLYNALKSCGLCRCQERKWWSKQPAEQCRRCKALEAFEKVAHL